MKNKLLILAYVIIIIAIFAIVVIPIFQRPELTQVERLIYYWKEYVLLLGLGALSVYLENKIKWNEKV